MSNFFNVSHYDSLPLVVFTKSPYQPSEISTRGWLPGVLEDCRVEHSHLIPTTARRVPRHPLVGPWNQNFLFAAEDLLAVPQEQCDRARALGRMHGHIHGAADSMF